ncbi:hypothetical protein ACJJIK_03145 [Microbulbifer sp. ZKSA006]|uniref:hypothetical protein n=1 Tax=Microbulbifer sp. ZKSA006 TaxID=3243390 RepID=UPI004039A4C3
MKPKIQVLSASLRWGVLAISLFTISSLMIHFILFDQNLFSSSNHLFIGIWSQGDQYRSMLLLGQAPIFIVFGLFAYLLWRLFGEYAKGNYFGEGSDRCYLWLMWLYAALIPLRMMESTYPTYKVTS